MFGYVVVNTEHLSEEDREYYQACYCGLCRALKKRYGNIGRITLTYDMTFLILFLEAVYSSDPDISNRKCALHPSKPGDFFSDPIIDYAADMNIALVYYKFLDDWNDDNSLFSLMKSKLFKEKVVNTSLRFPRQYAAIEKGLSELSIVEKAGELNPDIPANIFGNILGEIFAIHEDEFYEPLKDFGKALGKFIYVLDACMDLKSDIKKRRYNPLILYSSTEFKEILSLLMSDCTEKYKELAIDPRRKNIIENILYSGIWTKFQSVFPTKEKEVPEDAE